MTVDDSAGDKAPALNIGRAVDWRFAATVGGWLARPAPPATDYTRRQAIEQFRKWAINALADERHPFTVAAKELKARHDAGEDIKLVCSCKPDNCHGDIIVELIEEGLV